MFSKHDAEIYPEFGMAMGELGRMVKPLIDDPAPDPASLNPIELFKLLKLGRHLGAKGEDWLGANYKMLTMSAVDLLSEWFECEQLIAPMAVSGIIGTFPRRALTRHRLRSPASLHG